MSKCLVVRQFLKRLENYGLSTFSIMILPQKEFKKFKYPALSSIVTPQKELGSHRVFFWLFFGML